MVLELVFPDFGKLSAGYVLFLPGHVSANKCISSYKQVDYAFFQLEIHFIT